MQGAIEARASIVQEVNVTLASGRSVCLTKDPSSAFRSSSGGMGGYTQVDIIRCPGQADMEVS